MKTLANRSFEVCGNWYAPLNYLKSFNSVVGGELLDTMSSAGDWYGFIIQQMGKNSFHIVSFSQENDMYGGFNVYTKLIGISKNKPSYEEVYELLNLLF